MVKHHSTKLLYFSINFMRGGANLLEVGVHDGDRGTDILLEVEHDGG